MDASGPSTYKLRDNSDVEFGIVVWYALGSGPYKPRGSQSCGFQYRVWDASGLDNRGVGGPSLPQGCGV
ncbi:hypothetical protein VNO78_25356 [Psophocarpus tetragonolobus]|uniref:Uncharacterized protein n=1 Tax=Psophocarpus tetragonolobus TaxID=3891 RepID=A0AAN9XEZ1_PSOTE